MTIYYDPAGPTLGTAFSWPRQILIILWSTIVFLPLVFYCALYWAEHPEWLAPRGAVYEPEKKYPLWTTRRIMELVASAAAVLAFSMVKLPGYELDLVSTGLTFSAIYWGAPVAGFGSMIGSALRATISGWSIADIVSCAFNDAALYSILAIVWRRFVEGRKIERRILGYILFLISWFVTHNLVWIPPYGVIAFPWEMFVPWWIFEYELWLIPVSAITIVLGIVGAESAIRLTRPK